MDLPESIGPYRIEGRLGEGGMGQVFLAYDDRLRRRVAIKQLRADASVNVQHRERLRREAQAVAHLNHPTIVQVFDILIEEDADHVVMEYVEGRSLTEHISGKPLPEKEILELGLAIARGLAEAHDKGIVHRDLKPENVIVTPSGQPKILDFGLAKRLWTSDHQDQTLSVEGTVIGTCRSMSPEQAMGEPVDHRSDLFSFGVLLYEAITGMPPFQGPSPLATLSRIITEQHQPVLELNPAASPELAALIDRLLAKDPASRPQSTEEVVHDLEQLLGLSIMGSSTQLTPPRLPSGTIKAPARTDITTPAPQKPRRRRSLILVAAIGLTAVLAGVLLLVTRSPSEPIDVAVLEPERRTPADAPATSDDAIDLAGSALRVELLRGLIARKGILTFDTSEVDQLVGSPVEVARGLGADEAVAAIVESAGDDLIRVTLRRVRRDGTLLWTTAFDVPPRDTRLLADVVASRLASGYDGFPLREGIPELEVRNEDYQHFLRLRREYFSPNRNLPIDQIVDGLAEVRRRSPRFLEAYLLEARAARYAFLLTGDDAYLERAVDLVDQARQLAPGDPRPLVQLFATALTSGELERAAEALDQMESLDPGDPEVAISRARLAEARGDVDRALELMRDAVRRRPDWQLLLQLADMEFQQGRLDQARRHFEDLLERSPENVVGLSKLAELELVGGAPERAEQIFLKVLERKKTGFYESANLGLARFLLGKYAEARGNFRRALAQQPQNHVITLNLADCELLLGNEKRALDLYRKVVERLESDTAARADWQTLTVLAQAQAHLQQTRRAVEAVQKALRLAPENPQVAFEAALVYALVEDRTSALLNTEKAITGGYQAHWFDFPWFDSLRDDPEFRELVARAGG